MKKKLVCNLSIILAERKRDGLPHTGAWLAETVGLSRQQISNIMGGMDLHVTKAIRISKAVNRTFKDIWPDEQEEL
jgi:DNA-binding XRE family transcriptional regulator